MNMTASYDHEVLKQTRILVAVHSAQLKQLIAAQPTMLNVHLEGHGTGNPVLVLGSARVSCHEDAYFVGEQQFRSISASDSWMRRGRWIYDRSPLDTCFTSQPPPSSMPQVLSF